MKNDKLLKHFTEIMNGTHGSNTVKAEIITYKNGNYISLNDIEREYIEYKKLDKEIEEFAESNNLDTLSASDRNEIIKHFRDKVDIDLFSKHYGFLRDFSDYMITKIDKMNENYVVNNYESKIQEKNQSIEIEDDELEL